MVPWPQTALGKESLKSNIAVLPTERDPYFHMPQTNTGRTVNIKSDYSKVKPGQVLGGSWSKKKNKT